VVELGARAQRGEVSLIIPTWNEEGWLPRLLRSARGIPAIREVIVADHDSHDATPELAARAGCVVVPGGRPSAARNHGAAVAAAPVLLFVDADCVLTDRAVRAAVDLLARPEIVGVHVRTVPVSLDWYCRLSYGAMHWYLRGLALLGVVQGVASFIAVRRDVFQACGGFDERVGVGEDADFLRRLSRQGRVVYCPDQVVFTSARRFHTERPWLFSVKVALWAALRLVHTRRSLVSYRWEHHARTAADEDHALAVLLRERDLLEPSTDLLSPSCSGEPCESRMPSLPPHWSGINEKIS